MMELTEQQKIKVADWVKEGCGLSEIQRRIAGEFDLRPTFMDVRFLILDLGLEIQDVTASRDEPKKPATDEPVADEAVADEAPEGETEDGLLDEGGEMAPCGNGGVTVDVDRIMKPGTLISGSVTFSDGVKASWMLDQYGRLALDAKQPGYRPSPEDVQSFQRALQNEVAKKGY